jgi:hypothetical protein
VEEGGADCFAVVAVAFLLELRAEHVSADGQLVG